MGSRQYWIFQSRPDRYDLRTELHSGTQEFWDATRYRELMQPGDIVFLWLSGETESRGVYGWGRIVSPPTRDEDGFSVLVQNERRFEDHVSIDRIKQSSELQNLQILRIAVGTNFHINLREAQAIARLANDNALFQLLSTEAIL